MATILLILSTSVYDADGDDVRCRWAENNECGGICRRFPANIIEREVSIAV